MSVELPLAGGSAQKLTEVFQQTTMRRCEQARTGVVAMNLVDRPNERVSGSETGSEGVSIVIPAYNEERGAPGVLEDLLAAVGSLEPHIPFEVIVVDDGSADDTSRVIQPFVGDRLTLLRHDRNRGYGAAIKTGARAARHPWILITDADGTYPNEFIQTLLEHREANDMIVGARIGANAAIPLVRRPPKWVLRKLAEYLSGNRIPDLNSGLRVMRRDLLDRYRHILPDGFSLTTTITLAMMSAGHRVLYVPIHYHERTGASKIRPIADTLGFLVLIFRTITYFEPLRVFLPAAALFVMSSAAVALFSYFYLGKLMDVTTVLLFVTGVHLMALGVVADILSRRLR